jgi:two-component system, chemotaxis family, protein-glutamate methylesterase/glutaminase
MPAPTAPAPRPEQTALVVIGAGDGGAGALARVIRTLPKHFPAALLALVHETPTGNRGRDFAEALRGHGAWPIAYAKEGERIHRSCWRLAPPGCHLLVNRDGRLTLNGGPKILRTGRPAVDLLFQSAATAFGPHVIGVLLSGDDGDGTDGLRAIKAAGGIAVVQSPVDATHPDMPRHAVLGDDPDHCVLLDAIGPLLGRLVQQTV